MRWKYRITIADALSYSRTYEGWYAFAPEAIFGALRTDEHEAHRGVGTTTTVTCLCLEDSPRRRSSSGLKRIDPR